MPADALTLAAIRDAWTRRMGPPDRTLALTRRAQDRNLPETMEILFFGTPGADRLPDDQAYLYVATAGLALAPPGDAEERAELLLDVRGRYDHAQQEEIGRDLAELAAELYAGGIAALPNRVISGVRLAPFREMDSVLLADVGVEEPDWLPGLDPPVRLVAVVPLYDEEADVIERIGGREASRRFLDEGVEWDDPARGPAALRPRASTHPAARGTMSEAKGKGGAGGAGKSATASGGSLDAVWNDIEAWYREHAPDQVENLAEGASDAQIAAFRKATKLSLPDDYEASLRRHDGYVYIDDYEYVPLENVQETWSDMKDNLKEREYEGMEVADTGGGVIKDTYWNAAWIPFAEDSGGNLLVLDMDPGPKGKKGQVVRWEVGAGPGPAGHDSFTAWLAAYRDELLAGKFKVVDGSVERK